MLDIKKSSTNIVLRVQWTALCILINASSFNGYFFKYAAN